MHILTGLKSSIIWSSMNCTMYVHTRQSKRLKITTVALCDTLTVPSYTAHPAVHISTTTTTSTTVAPGRDNTVDWCVVITVVLECLRAPGCGGGGGKRNYLPWKGNFSPDGGTPHETSSQPLLVPLFHWNVFQLWKNAPGIVFPQGQNAERQRGSNSGESSKRSPRSPTRVPAVPRRMVCLWLFCSRKGE